MSPEVKQAVESIKPLAHGYRAVLVIAEELEKIGNLDNARFETEKRLAEARQQLEDAIKARDAAKLEAKSVQDRAAEIFGDAQRESQKALDASQVDAETLRIKTDQTAARIIAASTEAAQEKVAAAEVKAGGIVDGALKWKAVFDAKREQAEAALAGVNAELLARSTELAALEQKLAAAKERAAEMLR